MGAQNIAEKLVEVNEVQPVAVVSRKDRPAIFRKILPVVNRVFEIVFALFFHRAELMIHVEPGKVAKKFRHPVDARSESWRSYPGLF